jgi:hypothetical protein
VGFVCSFSFFNRGKEAMISFLGLGFGSSVVVLEGFVSIFAYKADVARSGDTCETVSSLPPIPTLAR